MLQPPTKAEQIKLGVYRPDQPETKAPSLEEYKRWLEQASEAFIQAIHESELVESCFWHTSKGKVVNQTSAAALFYLMSCQDLIEIDDSKISSLLKGSTINWFKLKRKALVSVFSVSECNLVLAIRKIKASPDLAKTRMGAPSVPGSNAFKTLM